jgi:ATP-binding cassette subfamily B multidrug efflux pump
MDTYRNRDSDKNFQPDRISSYFKSEWPVLTVVTVTGLFYNVLITAQAYFEGQLAQMLLDIIGGSKALADMVRLALIFVLAILLIQLARCLKRYFVRVFANNINRRMKGVLYGNLLDSPAGAHEESDIGGIMTKAISDVDACTEGMRKFTTEVFDTGVAMISYCAMLFYYDWKLALISCAFPPLAYLAAYSLRKRVSLRAAQYKEASGRLNGETLDRVSGAVDYRILGAEDARDASYEERLADYEKAGVRSGVLETSLQPVYRLISTISVIFIVIMGASNVAGTGTAAWNIASFTTFLSCFLNLAEKSSKAAKLFNSVQKAKVSWERIRGLLKKRTPCKETVKSLPAPVDVKNLTLSYGDKAILDGVFFSAAPGEVIGVTGEIASGKSTLGKAFLCESPYEGSIEIGGRELSSIPEEERCGIVGYMGHNPEILSDTVKDNVMLGTEGTCR